MPIPNTEYRIAAVYVRIIHALTETGDGFNEYIFQLINKSGKPINIAGMLIRVVPDEGDPATLNIPTMMQPMIPEGTLEFRREDFMGDIHPNQRALVQLIKPGTTSLDDQVLALTPLRFSIQATGK